VTPFEVFSTPDGETLHRFAVSTTAGIIQCEASGPTDGGLVLLLHGAHDKASLRDWRVHLPLLGAAGFRTVAPSFPGYGVPPQRSEGSIFASRADLVLVPGGSVTVVLDLAALLAAGSQVLLVGEGWGAAVALAVAQTEPGLVAGIALYHCRVEHGRFPFEGPALKALDLPASVLWAEVGASEGRPHPPEAHSAALARVLRGARFVKVSKADLDTASMPEVAAAEESAMLLWGGWSSKEVKNLARGQKKVCTLFVWTAAQTFLFGVGATTINSRARSAHWRTCVLLSA
jgi:pimeloyl-ACP methyl ester carboxylesterase